MLLGGAREIRAARGRHGAPPDDLAAALHRGREELVLEIAVHEAAILDEAQHLARFREGAGERLLASDRADRRFAFLHQTVDLPHRLEPRVIRAEEPHGVDLARDEHGLEARIGEAITEIELARLGGEPLAPLGAWAVDAGDHGVAHAGQRLQVEMRDEARADEADAKLRQLLVLHELYLRRSKVRAALPLPKWELAITPL